MADKNLITIIELTVDRCSNSYGQAPCTAALGPLAPTRCFNTRTTCQDRANYAAEDTVIRLTTETSVLPVDAERYYPCIERVQENPTTVNIAGNDPKQSAFGRPATLRFSCKDFKADDRAFDRSYDARKSGIAQFDNTPQDMDAKASFFKYLKARWPTYFGAKCRVRHGHVVSGVFIEKSARTYGLSEMKGPDRNGNISIEAKDVLRFIEDRNALAPKISSGRLSFDLNAVSTTCVLMPEGIGDLEYPTSGHVAIGNEVIRFTRVADTLTLTRAQHKTSAATHSQDDTVQLCLVIDKERPDTTLNMLITDYTDLNASWAPLATKWEPEISRWMPEVRLERVIAKPTAVSKLIQQLAIIGVSIYVNPTDEEIELKTIRPPFGDVVHPLTDASILEIEQEDRDDARVTAVHIHSNLLDPTKSTTDAENYGIHFLATDQESADDYGFQSVREVFCPWLGVNSFDTVRVVAFRLVRAFRRAPVRFKVRISAEEFDLNLTDIVDITTEILPNGMGDVTPLRTQVSQVYEEIAGHEVEALIDAFRFDGRYGQIMPDETTSTYDTATDEEREGGAYISENQEPYFPDNTKPYEVI